MTALRIQNQQTQSESSAVSEVERPEIASLLASLPEQILGQFPQIGGYFECCNLIGGGSCHGPTHNFIDV